MDTLIYSRHQQTAEDIRILKRHVDELNELFVSAERMEQRGCGKAKRNNLLWEEQEPTGKINEKEGTCGNLKKSQKISMNIHILWVQRFDMLQVSNWLCPPHSSYAI